MVSARVVARATARPVCDALTYAMQAHGVPEQILTDNGKVFTARFGPGPGPVLFDRICTDNGIKHLLTAPRSPTTTGKVERWHKTLRREFLDGKVFASRSSDAQAQLDVWVRHYNHERPHQSIGRVPPIERFQLAEPREKPAKPLAETSTGVGAGDDAAGQRQGHDRVRHRHLQGRGVAGRSDRRSGLRGRAGADPSSRRARRDPRPPAPARQADRRRATRPPATTVTAVGVVAVGDPQGRLVRQRLLRRRQLPGRRPPIGVARCKSPSSVTPSRSPIGEQLIRSHKVKHDRTREHGALANPGGRPHRINAA